MLSKEEIEKWLLENCVDEQGDLRMTDLDFSDFKGFIDIGNWKVAGDLYQNEQHVKGNLYQNYQEVEGDLRQERQEVSGTLYEGENEAEYIKDIKNEEAREILKKALDTYGNTMQTIMVCEECAELAKASTKLLRYGASKKLLDDLVEEIADVLIVIETMKLVYNISDKEINRIKNDKLLLLQKRLEKS